MFNNSKFSKRYLFNFITKCGLIREAGPQTDLVLPEKILSAALEICREREKEHFRYIIIIIT